MGTSLTLAAPAALPLTTVLAMAAVAAVAGTFFGYTVVKHYLRARRARPAPTPTAGA